MAPESREWSVPAPVRTLLWWPAISFVLVVVAPNAAIGAIIVAGAALAVLGGLLAAAARRLRRRDTVSAEESTVEMHLDLPTMEIPPIEPAPQRRAA